MTPIFDNIKKSLTTNHIFEITVEIDGTERILETLQYFPDKNTIIINYSDNTTKQLTADDAGDIWFHLNNYCARHGFIYIKQPS